MATDDRLIINTSQAECRRSWSINAHERSLAVRAVPLLHPDSRIATIGSCFAQEIKRRLKKLGYATLPRYPEDFDRNRLYAPQLGEHTNHYHSFCILQEMEKISGLWVQAEDDYWEVPDSHIWQSGGSIWQDPYRRSVYGRTLAEIQMFTRAIDAALNEGIRQADVIIITLGLVEAWRKKDNGRFAAAGPGWEQGGGKGKLAFHIISFEENLANMRRALDLISQVNARAHAVLTVSPVPLAMTRRDDGCIVANMESKAILRAIAGQLARERSHVHYFPSYEIATYSPNPFCEDGRHVNEETVNLITQTFINAFGMPA